MAKLENWQLQIIDAIKLLKKNVPYISKEEIEYRSIIQYARDMSYSEKNITGNQVVKNYLKSVELELKVNEIDEKLSILIKEIESLGLYPYVIYEHNKGVKLNIRYIEMFNIDVPYFLNKAKKVFYPESLQVQEMFGADNLKLFEQWVPEYKCWIKDSNKKYLSEIFKEISNNITLAIDSL